MWNAVFGCRFHTRQGMYLASMRGSRTWLPLLLDVWGLEWFASDWTFARLLWWTYKWSLRKMSCTLRWIVDVFRWCILVWSVESRPQIKIRGFRKHVKSAKQSKVEVKCLLICFHTKPVHFCSYVISYLAVTRKWNPFEENTLEIILRHKVIMIDGCFKICS